MSINNYMDFSSFSHGQIQSKSWLCQKIKSHMPSNATIAILGSWYNVLSFMMLTQYEEQCQSILGIDIDPTVKEIADKINNAWMIGSDAKVTNITADVNAYPLEKFNLVINCSPEHIETNQWFDNIACGTTVCLQSSDIDIKDDDVWKCVNPNKTLDDFKNKYPLSQYHYLGTKNFRYDDWGYQRFMIIGVK